MFVEHTSALTVIQRFLEEFLILFMGGSSGVSVSISSGQSFSSSEYGIGFTYGSAATHFVPPYKYGYIVLKASFTVNIYKLEVKYQGTNEWRPAGRIKTFSNTNVWTELRTYS